MFRIITSLLFLAAAAFVATAQDADMGLASNERVIGYTVTNQIDYSYAYFDQVGTHTIGARMYASDLKAYAGCRIVGLRVAVGADLGRSRVFLYSVSGDNLTAIHEQRQRLYEGWNRIDFNGNGYAIAEGQDLFFGYDYTETEAMVEAQKGGIAFAGDYEAGSAVLCKDNKLYSLSGIGPLCVQLIVDVSNMDPYAVAFGFFDTGFKYKKSGELIEIMANIRNTGRDAISKLRMGWQYDDFDPQYVDLDANIPSGGSYTWQQILDTPAPLGIGSHTLRIFAAQADGHDLTANEENSRLNNIAVYDNTIPRSKVLLEVFTNSSSANSIWFNSILSQLGDANGTTIIAKHHFPGTPLATAESQTLFDRYAYTTPVFTINRAYFPGEAHIAYNVQDFAGLPTDLALEVLTQITAQDINSPCFASLEGSCEYDAANGKLNVDVNIDALPEASAIYGTLAVHVMLVEDGVKSAQTATGIGGRPITNNNYIHNNVVRLNHTGVNGQPVTLDNNKGTAGFSIPLNSEWNTDNMSVVIYLTKWIDEDIPADLKDADVVNAITIPLKGYVGVNEISNDAAIEGPSTFYTIGGVPVSGDNLAPGLYIERRADGSARKILVK